jgi:tetratricopeptide (TPR) repeat protein
MKSLLLALSLALGTSTLLQGQQAPTPARQSCHVAEPTTPSPADEAFAKKEFADAERLYGAMPPSSLATAGVVRSLLGERKLDEALILIQKETAAHPGDPILLDVLGEVRFRRGEVEEAVNSYNASSVLDPCSARTHFDIGRYLNLNGLYASAQKQLDTAHKLDPGNPLIARAWESTQRVPLAPEEVIAQLEKREQTDTLTDGQKTALENSIKAIQAHERGDCQLAAPLESAKIPLFSYQVGDRPPFGSGVDVFLNGKRRRFKLDTGASGLLISSDAAKALGLTPEAETRSFGIGDEGMRTAYLAHVDDLKIGSLEFHHCIVHVFEAKEAMKDQDGLIGADVFRSFLVTLDFPAHEMRLSPLPKRPDDSAQTGGQPLSLSTSGDSGPSEALTFAERRRDRYIAPDMATWTCIFRSGHMLIFPTVIGNAPKRLLVMDTGAAVTIVSPDAAREVTRVTGDSDRNLHGISGEVKHVMGTDTLTIAFAGVRQIQSGGVTSVDTSNFGRGSGVEISGFIGYPLLRELVIAIDYRDNLVHVVYTPHLDPTRR